MAGGIAEGYPQQTVTEKSDVLHVANKRSPPGEEN
jgi:hypothetical protein